MLGNPPELPVREAGGAEGNRTPDLCSAIAALSHLSYSPARHGGRPNSGAFPLWQRLPILLFTPALAPFASASKVAASRNGALLQSLQFQTTKSGRVCLNKEEFPWLLTVMKAAAVGASRAPVSPAIMVKAGAPDVAGTA